MKISINVPNYVFSRMALFLHTHFEYYGRRWDRTLWKVGSRDLNNDGEIINLAIVGSSRYYDFESFENIIIHGWGLMLSRSCNSGRMSGVDHLAEKMGNQ